MKKYQNPPYLNAAQTQNPSNNYVYPAENPSYLSSSSNNFTNHEEPKKAAVSPYNHEYQSYVKPEPESVPTAQNNIYKPYYPSSYPSQYQSTTYPYQENPIPNNNYVPYYHTPATTYQETPKYELEPVQQTHEEPVNEKAYDFNFENKPFKKSSPAPKKPLERNIIANRSPSPVFQTNFNDLNQEKNIFNGKN